MKFYKAAT